MQTLGWGPLEWMNIKMNCPKNKDPHFESELRNYFELIFFHSHLKNNPHIESSWKENKKEKENTKVCELSKDNDIISGEPSCKKCKVLQPITPLHTNHVLPIILEPLFSLESRLKLLKLYNVIMIRICLSSVWMWEKKTKTCL